MAFLSELSNKACVSKDNIKKRTASESVGTTSVSVGKLTKRQKTKRDEAPKIVAEPLAKWIESNKDVKAMMPKVPAKGSKKGCMKGKGGPENGGCNFRGEPSKGKIRGDKLWLGTFESAVQAAPAYDEAAKAFYGQSARLNLPNYHDNTPLPCKAATSCNSITTYSEGSEVQESKSGLDWCSPTQNECQPVKVITSVFNCFYQCYSEHEMIELDELLGLINKSEVNNEAAGYPLQDAWYENKQDVSQNESIYMQQDACAVAPNYSFDFLDEKFEVCNFNLEEFGLSLDPTESV